MAFDYRQFLAENKLTKVSKGRETGKAQILSEGLRIAEGFDTPDMAEEMDEANKQKEDYLKRQERAQKGNWKGSIGAFVEEHGEELGNMISKNRQQLKDYVENVMKPELTDEAKQKVDELLDSKKSTFGFIQSLYNFTLKGSGMGLNEEDDMSEENLMEMAMNHASLGGERNRKKPGVKPGTANQDKMAKSEMKGDEIEVTIGGVKKAVSQRAFNKYRKMTDPEEKKAWKQKHGFIKEGKTLKEGLGYVDVLAEETEPGVADAIRAIYNHYSDGENDICIYINSEDAPGFAVIKTNSGTEELDRVSIMDDYFEM